VKKLRKIICLLWANLVLLSGAWAQEVSGVAASAPAADTSAGEAVATTTEQTQTEEGATVEVPLLNPFEVTAEQKKAMKKPARAKVRSMVSQQTQSERQMMMDILAANQRKIAKLNALHEGKSLEEANQAADALQKPEVDVKDDQAVTKYLYQQSGLTNDAN
jgi:hypothetical protein